MVDASSVSSEDVHTNANMEDGSPIREEPSPSSSATSSPVMNKHVEPKTIIFCLPGNNYSATFLMCWTSLLNYCNDVGHRVVVSQSYNPNIYFVRNECLGTDFSRGVSQKPFDGKIKYDYMFWIDSDIVFTPKAVQELIDMNKDVSTGLYLMKNNYEYSIVERMDFNDLRSGKAFKFLNKDTVNDKHESFKIDYCGFGFLCIKYGVMESLPYPFFRPRSQELLMDRTFVRDYSSEDVSWCLDIREKGYEIWANPAVRVGHEKNIVLI